MVAGHGRGGGQVGCGGRSTEREKTEAEKVRSDAVRIRGCYRYRNPPAAFAKHESEQYLRGCAASSSTTSSSRSRQRMRESGSNSRQRLSTALVVKMEDAEPETEPPRLPHFAPGDYLDDEQLKLLPPQLGVNAGLASGDFVAERELDTVVGLVARSSQQDTDKAAEWRHIAAEQDHVYVDLASDDE